MTGAGKKSPPSLSDSVQTTFKAGSKNRQRGKLADRTSVLGLTKKLSDSEEAADNSQREIR
jgi:hypothetical protein